MEIRQRTLWNFPGEQGWTSRAPHRGASIRGCTWAAGLDRCNVVVLFVPKNFPPWCSWAYRAQSEMDLPRKVHPTYSVPTARRPALYTRLTQCQPVHGPTICSPFRSVTEPHHLPCIGIAVACACCAVLAGPSNSKMGMAISARGSRLAPLPICGTKSRVHTPHASVQLSLTHSKKRHSCLDRCQSRKEMGCSTEPPARSTLPARGDTPMP